MLRISFKALVVTIAAVALQLVATSRAQAGFVLVTSSASLGGNDTIDWSVLGPSFTPITNPFSVTSTGGVTAGVSQLGSPNFERRDQGNGWGGNFAPGDPLLWSVGPNGPMTIDFANTTTVTAAGAQIQADFFGTFKGVVEALAADGTVLASFTANGISNGNGDNSAIFIGIQATGGDSFDKIRFGVTDVVAIGQDSADQDFAIGQVDLQTVSNLNTVPAPAGAILFGLGMTSLGGFRLFRRKRAPASA